MLNKVILMGRLTKAPELRHTRGDIPVAKFSLAVDRRFKTDGQNVDFINIVAFRNTAEFVARWFTKGLLVAVSGRLQVRTYKDRDGNDRVSYEVVADEAFFAEGKRDAAEQEKECELPPPVSEDFEELVGDDENLPF